MNVKIGHRRPRRLYLKEHREARGLTQEKLAQRLKTTAMTVSRWERRATRLTTDALDAIAEAIGPNLDGEDLFHHPDQPSPNQLLRGQPPEVVENAIRLIMAIRK